MFRFNPLHTVALLIVRIAAVRVSAVTSATSRARRFRRVALLVVMLTAVPAAAQEVSVTISMNTCWNNCTMSASAVHNYYYYDMKYSWSHARRIAEGVLDDCLDWCDFQ